MVTGRQEGAGEAKARRYFEKENAANAGKSEGCGGSGGFTQKETVVPLGRQCSLSGGERSDAEAE